MNGIAMLCEAVYRRANGQGWEVVGIQYAEFFDGFLAYRGPIVPV